MPPARTDLLFSHVLEGVSAPGMLLGIRMLPEQEVREDDAAIHLPPRSPFSGSPPGEQ